MKKAIDLRKRIYIFVIVLGLVCIFSPIVAHADIFGMEVYDVYVEITENVKETNDLLVKAFEFSQTSPYDVISKIDVTTEQGKIATGIRDASKTVALVVAVLLLMVDFFRKSINFEWSSKWENILLFLIKIIVVKQVVQNADVIVADIYGLFQTINDKATHTSINFLPCGNEYIYKWTDDGMFANMIHKGWWDFWTDVGSGDSWHFFAKTYDYDISEDAVKMFYPDAVFADSNNHDRLNLNKLPLESPTALANYFPTLEKIKWQPYFLIMKAIAYVIFVVIIGRVFELCIYTILAPLPLATFASETTHDVGKSFIKNYIAVVLQIAVIVVMFIVYQAVNTTVAIKFSNSMPKLLQLVVLMSLGLGVVKSGAWSKKICGIG